MSNNKLIALDMDGTLLNSQKQISKANNNTIEHAINHHKHVVLSTGRAISELKDYQNLLSIIKYGICESGALIYDFQNNKIINQETIPTSIVKKIVQYATKQDIMIQLISDGKSIVDYDHLNCMAKYHMQKYQSLFNRVALAVDNLYEYAINHQIEKINLYHQDSIMRKMTYNFLQTAPLNFAFAETTSLEISPLNISKAHGLLKFCNYLNLDINETIAVGDSNNDLEILKTVGLSIAMGNALDEIKSICDVIVSDNDHDGCKEAIETYL